MWTDKSVRSDMGIGPYIVDADSILPVADL
jgi:hypothetical protein